MEEAGEPEQVFRTSSLDEARSIGSDIFYPQELRRVGNRGRLAMTMKVMRNDTVTVADLQYGTDIKIVCGELEHAYHVNIPLTGHLESRHGRASVTATPRQAAVYGPVGETELTRWSSDCRQLCVKIDREAVENELERYLDRSVPRPIVFGPTMDLTAEPERGWLDMVQTLTRQLRGDGGLAHHPLVATSLTRALTAGLLLTVDHCYRDELVTPRSVCRPPAVRQAIETIESVPDHLLTTSQLAADANVSVRALQVGFQRYVGMSPMSYLRAVRLRRAHEDLVGGDPAVTTVAAVAHRWGFVHLGRFAATYEKRYGKPPSQTLRS